MAAQTTPAPTDLKALIAAAGAEREAARELLNLARAEGNPTEVAVAEAMVKDALKAYRALVPSEPKKAAPTVAPVTVTKAPTAQEALAEALVRIKAQEAAKPTLDPTRLSGTEIRRTAAGGTAAEAEQRAAVKARADEAAAAAKDRQLGAYLEPRMQELLADQTLRAEALHYTRRLTKWLLEADQHCANQQPVLARKFIGLAKAELVAQEQALRDADKVAAKSAPKGAK